MLRCCQQQQQKREFRDFYLTDLCCVQCSHPIMAYTVCFDFKNNPNIFLYHVTFLVDKGALLTISSHSFPDFSHFGPVWLHSPRMLSHVLLSSTDNTGNMLEGRQTGRHKEAAYSKTCLVLKGMERSWLLHGIVLTTYRKKETE